MENEVNLNMYYTQLLSSIRALTTDDVDKREESRKKVLKEAQNILEDIIEDLTKIESKSMPMILASLGKGFSAFDVKASFKSCKNQIMQIQDELSKKGNNFEQNNEDVIRSVSNILDMFDNEIRSEQAENDEKNQTSDSVKDKTLRIERDVANVMAEVDTFQLSSNSKPVIMEKFLEENESELGILLRQIQRVAEPLLGNREAMHIIDEFEKITSTGGKINKLREMFEIYIEEAKGNRETFENDLNTLCKESLSLVLPILEEREESQSKEASSETNIASDIEREEVVEENMEVGDLTSVTSMFKEATQYNLKGRLEQEARERAEQEAREKAEQEARERAEQEARERAEQEARGRAEQEARERAEQEARERAEQEARERAEQEARERAEQENRARIEEEAKRMFEQENRERAERLKYNIRQTQALAFQNFDRVINFRNVANQIGIKYDSTLTNCLNIIGSINYDGNSVGTQSFEYIQRAIGTLQTLDIDEVRAIEENEVKRTIASTVIDIRLNHEYERLGKERGKVDARKVSFLEKITGKRKEIEQAKAIMHENISRKMDALGKLHSDLMNNGISHDYQYKARDLMAEIELLQSNAELSPEDTARLNKCKQTTERLFKVSRNGIEIRKREKTLGENGEYDVDLLIKNAREMIPQNRMHGRNLTSAEKQCNEVVRIVKQIEREEMMQNRMNKEDTRDEK